MNLSPDADLPIANGLIAQGLLSKDQLQIALKEQASQGRPIGEILIKLGFIGQRTWQQSRWQHQGIPDIDLGQCLIDGAALALVPQHLAKRHRIIPLRFQADQHCLTVATAAPNDLGGIDRLLAQLPAGLMLDLRVASDADIEQAIDRHYGHELSIDGILHEMETGEIDRQSLPEHGREYRQPTVRLIDAILSDAVKQGASDIHFEPEENFLRVRYRVDGLLRQIRVLHKSYWPAMAVRLKVMSEMNIAESRSPQDGRIGLTIAGRLIDFRAASQPTIHGENIVLRILDRHKGIVPLDSLGLEAPQMEEIHRMLARPEGIVLVTGPTGCGKTTTLYSILNHLNCESVHIMTLEDPVEYPMAMIRQTSVAETANLGFANGIRSMMRQDPDIILVGEIRDSETATMAFSAAMTGHQVFSTLHTNSAIASIPRLLDLGIPPDLMAGNIIGIVAQRLVRHLCPNCKREEPANEFERKVLERAAIDIPPKLCHPSDQGCEHCRFTGYHGRLAIMEVLRVTDRLDELIARRPSTGEVLHAATGTGYTTLASHGFHRVMQGATNLAELARVVDLSEFM